MDRHDADVQLRDFNSKRGRTEALLDRKPEEIAVKIGPRPPLPGDFWRRARPANAHPPKNAASCFARMSVSRALFSGGRNNEPWAASLDRKPEEIAVENGPRPPLPGDFWRRARPANAHPPKNAASCFARMSVSRALFSGGRNNEPWAASLDRKPEEIAVENGPRPPLPGDFWRRARPANAHPPKNAASCFARMSVSRALFSGGRSTTVPEKQKLRLHS